MLELLVSELSTVCPCLERNVASIDRQNFRFRSCRLRVGILLKVSYDKCLVGAK